MIEAAKIRRHRPGRNTPTLVRLCDEDRRMRRVRRTSAEAETEGKKAAC
jgi:hypothetical protein